MGRLSVDGVKFSLFRGGGGKSCWKYESEGPVGFVEGSVGGVARFLSKKKSREKIGGGGENYKDTRHLF